MPAPRAVAAAAASSLFTFSSSVDWFHTHTLLADSIFSDEPYQDCSSSPAIRARNPGASTSSAVGPLPAAAAATSPFRYSMRSNAAMWPPTDAKASRTAARVAVTFSQRPSRDTHLPRPALASMSVAAVTLVVFFLKPPRSTGSSGLLLWLPAKHTPEPLRSPLPMMRDSSSFLCRLN
jgi:hypothetical protein